jgi:hypothetical protein
MNTSLRSLLAGFCCLALFPALPPAQAEGADAGQIAAPAAAEDRWVTIEPGSRPAYVGIHGGTAPISLLRASNGLLFAFTGQTGNDFLHILRGNATSAPDASPATPGRDRAAEPAPAAASLPETAAPAAGPPSPAGENAGAGKVALTSAQASPVPLPEAPALAEKKTAHPLPRDKTPLPPTRVGDLAPSSSQEDPSPPPAPSAAAGSVRPADADAAAESDAPPRITIPPAVEASLSDVPAGGPSLVFATGDLAHALVESQAFVPFGLPLPGEKTAEGEKKIATPDIPPFRPIKLLDYRPLLRYPGGL